MSPSDIASVRTKLGLTQLQLAQLLGVHPLTVSKWERGLLEPTHHQAAMLDSFRRARQAKSDVGELVATLLVSAGVAIALYALLSAAFGKKR